MGHRPPRRSEVAEGVGRRERSDAPLVAHPGAGLDQPAADQPAPDGPDGSGPHGSASAVLLCDRYQGWHHALSTCGLTQTGNGRSWPVEVVVKPLGWLGTYRLSRETGLWFSGMHRWHQLGQ